MPTFSSETLFASCLLGLLWGSISAFLSHRRGRNPYLWFAIGFCLGIFGLMAIFFATSQERKAAAPQPMPREPVLTLHGPSDKFWYYLSAENEQHGPMSRDALFNAWNLGKLSPSTYVWHEELPDWRPLEELLKSS